MRNRRPPPSTGTPAPGLARTRLAALAPALACLIATASPAADPPPAPAPAPVLHLGNGGYAAGELVDSDRKGVLRWRSPAFAEPFDFAAGSVNAVHWPPAAQTPRPEGDYGFELAGGDVLYGSLADLDDRQAVLESPKFGRLRVDRSAIRRIDRWRDGADLIYSGPNGLVGWKEPEAKGAWREESGQPITDKEGAALRGDFALPARAVVEFEVSWKGKPDFLLALGVGDEPKEAEAAAAMGRRARVQNANPEPTSLDDAFRFEVWDGQLVAHRQTEAEADVASVQAIDAGAGRAHLQAYLDQERGRMTVVSSSGRPLADLKVSGPKSRAFPGIHLANLKGDVRLERLRISRWNGDPPREAKGDQARIHLADGSIVYGQIAKFDPSAREFLVRGESGEQRIAEAKIAAMFLSPPKDEPDRSVLAVYQDGSRLGGDLVRVEGGGLRFSLPGVEGDPLLPIAGLRSLVVLKREAAPQAREDRPGRLEMDGLLLPGHLAEGREGAGASGLAWRPGGSATASPLRPGASGRIIYKEPPPKPVAAPNPRAVRGRVIAVPAPAPVGVAQGFLRALTDAPPGGQPPSPAGGRRAIHLRTGDIIPSEVTKIDEAGVTFRTPLSESTFVPNEKVKAVELAPSQATTVRLNKSKQERLLTLPRMQKESPPTHMIRARNGDYLRGRLVAMDDKTLQVEVRLETKPVPRDRISRIIWLHPDETDPAKAPAVTPGADGATRVQALRSDGVRLTFVPERFADAAISGRSDVLGACRVPLKDVDQLLLGSAIEQAASQAAYGPWRLKNAVEPKVAQDDGDGNSDRAPGTESALIGKPAPDFKLDLMGGKPFRLSEHKGEVVVLDFWATWCGPCLQAMPQVERATDEFKDQGVRLIAVNLQESPEEIAAMLERHKLRPTVALDRDGVVADRYAAAAIPQTVIIDKQGNIARLFVGGGPKFGDQLRTAIADVLADAKPAEAPKGPVKE